MRDLLSIGTSRGCEMIGTGIGLGLSGFRLNPPGIIPALDLNFASSLSLTSTSGITPSFSRASTGTYFNSAGVLTSAAVNEPRFDYAYNGTRWVSKGLLVEEQRTNFRKDSNTLSSSFSTGPAQLSSAAIASPDATLNAWKFFEAPSASGSVLQRLYDPAFVYSGSQSTFSIFAKAGERKRLGVFLNINPAAYGSWFDLTTGSSGNDGSYTGATQYMTNVGNGWYRCNMVVPSGNPVTNAMQLYVLEDNSTNITSSSRIGDGTSGLYLAFAQFETGSFPTSYIPTVATSVVRSADVCQITDANSGSFSSFWNTTEGSVVLEQDLLSYSDPAADQRYFSIGGSTNTPAFILNYDNGTNFFWYRNFSGLDQLVLPDVNSAFKVALAFKTNDYATVLNGGSLVTSPTKTLPTNFYKMDIGYQVGATARSSWIQRLRYYNTRLTNSQLQGLTL
jgi:hypothetical protein